MTNEDSNLVARGLISAFALLLFFVVMLSACATKPLPPVWSFYDQCAQSTASFVAMAECGKANRYAFCTAHNVCSSAGNAFVLYTDSLITSTKDHEMSEAEAQRKWVEFRMSQQNADRSARIQALQAMPRSTTCYSTGSMTQCY
ncbi:hypothetical protein [Rhodopila sp.]|uniref:hypothetical protein n=1 Tax=Rhodopila sp. TaxID=2480087 RepID=UPI003D1358D6